MSTTTQPTADLSAQAKAAATQAVGTGAYVAERGRQGASALQERSEGHGQQAKSALDNLERNLEKKTDEAVEEGKADVQAATEAGESYIGKALHMVDAGLAGAQSYLVAGKERLTSPAPGGEEAPATGIMASLASTTAAALDVTQHGLEYVQHTLHEKGPAFPHAQTQGPAHPVTVPTKPLGQALSDNVGAAQAAVQPHVDAAKEAAQPHIDAAKPYVDSAAATVKPKLDVAAEGLQVQVDAVKGAMSSDKPIPQQVQEAGQAAVDTAKPYVAAAGDAVASVATTAGNKVNQATKPTDKEYTV